MDEGHNDSDLIDDSLVNFGISDDNLDLLLIEVSNGKNPALAAKIATEGVAQKGMANLHTRIFALAIKDSSGALIKAAFDIVTGIMEMSSLPSALAGENPALVTCLRNLEKICMSGTGDDWENLPEILEAGYIRWEARHCVAQIIIEWLVFPSWENEEDKITIGRQVKNTSVLLSKVGKRLFTDLPGRFVQIHQMAKKHLLSESCQQRSELLEIVIMLSSLNHTNTEVVNKTENEGKIKAQNVYREKCGSKTNLDSDDNDTDGEEMFSLADLGDSKLKEKSKETKFFLISPSQFEENEESKETNFQKNMRLISPDQFESGIAKYDVEKLDNVNNNKFQELSFNLSCSNFITEAKDKPKKVDKADEKSSKIENKIYSKMEIDMAKLRLTSAVNTFPETANDTKNVKNAPQAQRNNGAGDMTGLKRLGYLETIDNPKTGKISATLQHPVNDGSSVGRMPNCQVTISGPKVSRVHAEIYKNDDGIFLKTVSKTNGCRVNMEAVGTGKSKRIKSGDKIEIGGVPFVWLENISKSKNEEELNKVCNQNTQRVTCRTFELESNPKDGNEEIYKKHQKTIDLKAVPISGQINRKIGKKNKPSKSNVAFLLEANAKKIKKSSQDVPDSVPTSFIDMSIPPPNLHNENIKNKSATESKGCNSFNYNDVKSYVNMDSGIDYLAPLKSSSRTNLAGTSKSEKENTHQKLNKYLPGKQFTFTSSQIKTKYKCPLPNVSIPPPNFGIHTHEMDVNPQRNIPKVSSFGERNIAPRPPVKEDISQSNGSKVFKFPPGKELFSVSGQFEDYYRDSDGSFHHDKREFSKMSPKKQEHDDVVIESERFL